MANEFETADGLRGVAAKGCSMHERQLNIYDYMADVPGNEDTTDMVEVQFKHTRKAFYRNDNHLDLAKGDIVAVEASPGHDIGEVTLTGRLVLLQMKKANLKYPLEVKRVYRKAREQDLLICEEAKAREQATMIRARQIAKDLNLQMKIGDVEYQGDGNKAIFYYIADGRVDFRQLIKVLADAFKVRIEMRQIGARQEAGRIGGIGPCGRELCCTTWMRNFDTVSTNAVRCQDLSPNPQKLAGQCAKLKCCLNYEVDQYIEAARKLPARREELYTVASTYYFFKADILSGKITYSTDKRMAANLVEISADRAKDIIEMNRQGLKPETLVEDGVTLETPSVDLVQQESLTRFDGKPNKKRRSNGGNRRYRDRTNRPKEGYKHGDNVVAKQEVNNAPKREVRGEKRAHRKMPYANKE